MKSKLVATFAISMIIFLANAVFAESHGKAAGTSHELEEVSIELHNYMQRTYRSSFGTDGMKVAAGRLHQAIHDWENGQASQREVVAAQEGANGAFDEMETELRDNGFLKGLRQDGTAERLFLEVQTYLVQLNALLSGSAGSGIGFRGISVTRRQAATLGMTLAKNDAGFACEFLNQVDESIMLIGGSLDRRRRSRHFVHSENPRAFNESVRSFLKELKLASQSR